LKPESLSRRKRSIAAVLPISNQIGNRGQHTVAKYRTATRSKIRHFHRLNPRRFGHNAGYDAVALAELHDFTGLEPTEKLASVAELTDVDAWHDPNVAQLVPQVNCRLISNGLFVP
jgi:hypothetical protein